MKRLLMAGMVCVATAMGVCHARADVTGSHVLSVGDTVRPADLRAVRQKESSRGFSPFGLSLVPPLQLPAEDWDVTGLRLNLLMGRNRDVGFIDLGVLANIADCDSRGITVSGVFNKVDGEATGIVIAPLNFTGSVSGVEVGLFNRVERGMGLMVGLVNYAGQFDGMQIGFINVIADSALPVLPLVNIGF